MRTCASKMLSSTNNENAEVRVYRLKKLHAWPQRQEKITKAYIYSVALNVLQCTPQKINCQ